MKTRWMRYSAAWLLCLAVATSSGCSSFSQGYDDGIERLPSGYYGWGHEVYEIPIGLAVLPVQIALTPFIALVPHEEHGMGYLLGETWAGNRILLDPAVNYGG